MDLIPKCIMACGTLVKMLLHTKVTRYLEFKSMDASYVYRNGKVLKVPVTISEVLTSSLLSLFEKRRFRKFLVYISTWDAADKSTHEGRDLTRESETARRSLRRRYSRAGFVLSTHSSSSSGFSMLSYLATMECF